MMIRPINVRRKGERTYIPGWLSDPDGVAPCICGRSLLPGEPHIMATGEYGMKRWFHATCFAMIENEMDDEDWDDEDEDE